MNNIRLLPIVIMAVAALLVLKTVGLVTDGGYVLGGATQAMAAGEVSHGEPAGASGEPVTLPPGPTIEDATPTISDSSPTMGEAAAGDHGAPAATDHEAPAEGRAPAAEVAGEEASADDHAEPAAEPVSNVIAAENACAPVPVVPEGGEVNPDGELTVLPPGCALPEDALPQIVTPDGTVPLSAGTETMSEQALLQRLGARRAELESYEQELAMRESLVEAAEQRIAERQQTLQSIEAQIAALVEQRQEMEAGQFAGIVSMYENMRPGDAATIFNALDMEVLVNIARLMNPRRLSPILADMNTLRAQELTVRLASTGANPSESMTPDDLAALPQIVGQ